MRTTFTPVLLLILSVIITGTTMAEKANSPQNQVPLGKALLIDVVENRYPQLQSSALDCAELIPEFKDAQFDGGCMLSKRELPVMMFVGDSHMEHYKHTIVSKFQSESVAVLEQTRCLPFASDKLLLEPSCKKKQDLVLNYISNSRTIKTVILSARWDAFMVDFDIGRFGENWGHARTPSEEDAKNFKNNARKFISTVLNSGKQVVFMKDIPDLDFDIRTCYDIRPVKLSAKKIRQDCSMDQADYVKRLSAHMTYLDQLLSEFPTIKIYDPRPLFCHGGKCIASDGRLPYYLNADHVNRYGADMVINDLMLSLH